MRVYLLVMLIAAAVTYFMVPVVRRIALVSGAITQVRDRDVHTLPIPRLGGVAMLIGLAVSFAVASQIPYLSQEFSGGSLAWGILAGAALMCLVGVIDDIWELDWYAKLAGEILAAGVMAWQGVQFVSVPVWGLTVGSTRLTLFLTIIVVVVVANAINFIDGLDGLAAGVVGIAGLAFFVYTYMLTRESSPGDYSSIAVVVVAALVGICLGFLPHNFNPATIFMGDSGALMLGLVCAAAGIVVTGQIDPSIATNRTIPAFMPIVLPIAILIIPLLDFVYAVLRRLSKGQSPFTADSGHLHHRLLRAGNSHRGAVMVIYLWSALFSFLAVGLSMFDPKPVLIIGAIGLLLALGYTKFEMKGAPKRAVSATRKSESATAQTGSSASDPRTAEPQKVAAVPVPASLSNKAEHGPLIDRDTDPAVVSSGSPATQPALGTADQSGESGYSEIAAGESENKDGAEGDSLTTFESLRKLFDKPAAKPRDREPRTEASNPASSSDDEGEEL